MHKRGKGKISKKKSGACTPSAVNRSVAWTGLNRTQRNYNVKGGRRP